jgi:DNA-binding beta-propeller fold protein YncE
MPARIALSAALLLATGCNNGVFGGRTGILDRHIDVMADSRTADLANPQDLAFNPENGELWVVNKDDDSVSIFDDVLGDPGEVETIVDPFAQHFMEKVTSIAFGAPGTFATCQDGRNTYNDAQAPNDFTGPSLWSSDREEFGLTNPAAVDVLGFDLGSHLDMLHESPQCMGIAWQEDNIYWVFDGANGDIVRYDFAQDHGLGFDDHCDGDIQRWDIDVDRVAGIPSHMVFDQATDRLYVSDTGNDRVIAVDTTTGSRGVDLPSVEDGSCAREYDKEGPDHYSWEGGDFEVVVEGISRPSGIALVDDTLIVVESATGFLRAYDPMSGEEIDAADSGRGGNAIGGILAPSLDELWMVDFEENELLYIGR